MSACIFDCSIPRLNGILEYQLAAEARRVSAAGDVAAAQTAAGAAETEYSRLQETKRLQDLYSEREQAKMEQLELQAKEYAEQVSFFLHFFLFIFLGYTRICLPHKNANYGNNNHF